MDFLHHVISFIWSEASQIGHGIASPVELPIHDCVSVGLILFSPSLAFIFWDLSFCQILEDRIDPACRIVNRHDVVDGFFGTRLGQDLDRRLAKSPVFKPRCNSHQTISLNILGSRDLLNLEPSEALQLLSSYF